MLKLIANVQSFDNYFVAWIENTRNIKGMVVEGSSVEEVMKELLMSLKVKIAYDLGIDINSIDHKEFRTEEEFREFRQLKLMDGKAKKEINLSMSL
jgi:hypothetical protein